jgi:glyoxylase-like metal-dependent hydrolase (beta-lactamase superfamily II)
VRAAALHTDVLLLTSAVWQTNCLAVRSEEECFLIDSPVLPDELGTLPALLEQARFPAPNGLLITHADWDHMLGRLAVPEAPLGCSASTAERMRSAPGEPQRELRAFDEEHYLERPRPLTLGSVQVLDVPGFCEVGSQELELHPADGHTRDGTAVWIGWAGVLVAGDYLSSVEIPVIGKDGSVEAYLATLERLGELVARAEHIVAGHGPLLERSRALELLEQDREYLRLLRARGQQAKLPAERRGATQRRLHAENAAKL